MQFRLKIKNHHYLCTFSPTNSFHCVVKYEVLHNNYYNHTLLFYIQWADTRTARQQSRERGNVHCNWSEVCLGESITVWLEINARQNPIHKNITHGSFAHNFFFICESIRCSLAARPTIIHGQAIATLLDPCPQKYSRSSYQSFS